MNQKKNHLTTAKESGFTLVEVIVAVAILSFAIFATLRVITASLNSITRQGQRVKALHLAQAHLAKLEAESFSKVVPEILTVSSDPYNYVVNRFSYQIVGDGDTEYVSDGEIVVYDAQGNNISSDCTDNGTVDDKPQIQISGHNDETIYIDYKYYHRINEGGTIPSSDEQGIKEGIIRIATDAGTLSSITVKETDTGNGISPDSYSWATRELSFTDSDEEKSVWIYYLPQKTTDGNGDGCEDPTDDSILGVVEGSFCNPDGSFANQITNTKKVTVTEYWKQGKDIQRTRQETYITR
jgi:prepilin-type N-terminal cleavage/methylation domain-containing protein